MHILKFLIGGLIGRLFAVVAAAGLFGAIYYPYIVATTPRALTFWEAKFECDRATIEVSKTLNPSPKVLQAQQVACDRFTRGGNVVASVAR